MRWMWIGALIAAAASSCNLNGQPEEPLPGGDPTSASTGTDTSSGTVDLTDDDSMSGFGGAAGNAMTSETDSNADGGSFGGPENLDEAAAGDSTDNAQSAGSADASTAEPDVDDETASDAGL